MGLLPAAVTVFDNTRGKMQALLYKQVISTEQLHTATPTRFRYSCTNKGESSRAKTDVDSSKRSGRESREASAWEPGSSTRERGAGSAQPAAPFLFFSSLQSPSQLGLPILSIPSTYFSQILHVFLQAQAPNTCQYIIYDKKRHLQIKPAHYEKKVVFLARRRREMKS